LLETGKIPTNALCNGFYQFPKQFFKWKIIGSTISISITWRLTVLSLVNSILGSSVLLFHR